MFQVTILRLRKFENRKIGDRQETTDNEANHESQCRKNICFNINSCFSIIINNWCENHQMVDLMSLQSRMWDTKTIRSEKPLLDVKSKGFLCEEMSLTSVSSFHFWCIYSVKLSRWIFVVCSRRIFVISLHTLFRPQIYSLAITATSSKAYAKCWQ